VNVTSPPSLWLVTRFDPDGVSVRQTSPPFQMGVGAYC